MNAQIAVQHLLQKKFAEIQKKNPQYSLRAYAKKVGVHAGALSSILNGRRNVSRSLAERIAKHLLLDPQERSELLSLFPVKQKRNLKGAIAAGEVLESRYLELSAAQFKIVAEWEHLAFLSLMNCKSFSPHPEWIARKLEITAARAETVIQRLLEVGMIEKKGDTYVRVQKNYRTSDDIADISLKKFYEQNFELAQESLYRDPVEQRDFTSITMAVDPQKLSMAKELVRKFQDDVSDLLETGERTEVYRLSMQLFPLTKLESKI